MRKQCGARGELNEIHSAGCKDSGAEPPAAARNCAVDVGEDECLRSHRESGIGQDSSAPSRNAKSEELNSVHLRCK